MKYKIGEKVKGVVTGIQPYGVFVELDEETQGLIHISELKHAFVKEINEYGNIGDEVEVMIMDIDEYSGKISLSIRSLTKTSYHPFSNRKRNPRYGRRTGTGFDSIKKKLPEWVEEALKDMKSIEN